ncbi:MAG: SH3 domain-containing protein, partial [Alphaproteobacteria bacterium]|nr:SH3 domain-containing protein [Alphaproteobacteria bacterium]
MPNLEGTKQDPPIGDRDGIGLNEIELQQLVTAASVRMPSEPVTRPAASNGVESSAVRRIVSRQYPSLSPRIVVPHRRFQCVPYARLVSGIRIYGNAHTWWRQAEGRYKRGAVPSVGSVFVMRPNKRTRLGHIAVVMQVLSSREIVVDHANWLNRERIHLGTPIVDVSPNNDWSAVRVWYTPGRRYGASVYRGHGFIYPKGTNLFTTVANANVRGRPSTKAPRVTTLPRRSVIEVIERVIGTPWYRVARSGEVLGYIYAPLIKPLT